MTLIPLRLPRLLAIACVTTTAATAWPASAATARADEDPPVVTSSLLDENSLAGWRVTGCEATVTDGVLKLVAGDGFVRSDFQYGDFVLDLEWRALGAGDYDSGIYFRSELPKDGAHWPTRYQCNLKRGYEGNAIGLKGAESRGLVKPGQWNRFVLSAVGAKASLDINGQRAWEADGLERSTGYIGFQAEVPLGGQFEFRNVKISEIGFRSLFNGRDLDGWSGGNGIDAAKCWRVEKGELICTGSDGPWLKSDREYDDFDLRLEYKLLAGGNSGVYIRVPEGGGHRGVEIDGAPGGVEVQLLDDADARYKDIEPYQFAASIYAIAPAREHVARPAGEWNSLAIEVRGLRYRVTHNGVRVIDATERDFPELANRLKRGFLGLQNHSEPVKFRRIRIGPPGEE